MRQIVEKRTQKINGRSRAVWRKHLEWLRIDLLQVWAAPRFDVDAYARIRYQIHLIINTAREAGDPPSSSALSPRRRRKWRQQRRSAPLTSPAIATPTGRYRAFATPMQLIPGANPAPRNSSAAP